MALLDRTMLLNQLPLRPSSLELFQKRGFTTVAELQEAKKGGLGNLAAELASGLPEAARLYREVTECATATASTAKTAVELLQETPRGASIITFCRAVDQLLDGGVAVGELTELAGPPGVGKTQFAMQLVVNAALPASCGGVEGQAIYIDSEGSFAADRCATMASALVDHITAGRRRRNQTAPLPEWFTIEGILSGIHVYRVHDETAQTAVLHGLASYCRTHARDRRPIKLIVIDSMAFHYRAACPASTDYVSRTRNLTSLANLLATLASEHRLAVVAVNQMTTKLVADRSVLVPALGESWAHAVTTRLLLADKDGQRTLELTKSPRLPSGSAGYQVVEGGIRGLEFKERKRPRTE